ncbi:hypothetical protein JY651_17775 [Pyxidicoccus parkwayensis]|uniref:Lipoprotein n=1 Tax=Pyxidicoccus parkwayensis TaxID=2813578 RepID=A0ABX7P8A4_9BACT|nr:hypothetical protein [Pyxidicoccus parkwaysis]QSQ26661.1 hypothetical protein JY651_17775 [Pyxidicoccus parkwaysis]
MRALYPLSSLVVSTLLAGCASTGQSRAQQVLLNRPPVVMVMERTASLTERPAGCAVEYVKKDLEGVTRTRRVAKLVVTGMGLDRAKAEELLTDRVCGLGGERVFISSEEYGRPGKRDEVEAVAYAFDTPVQVARSGLVADLAPKPPDCRMAFLRTKQPEARYQEVAGLHLKLPVMFEFGPHVPPQARAMDELRAAACHLGADAVLISQESYELPGVGTIVSGTAIVFEENLRHEKKAPRPDTQTL